MTIRIGLVAATIALAAAGGSAAAQSPRERGDYLINTIGQCANCHTAPNGAPFAGGRVFREPAYLVSASNITPDRETGIGTWSDDDIKRALTDGVRPNGQRLIGSMPSDFLKVLLPGDADAMVAYLRSLTPARNPLPAPDYKRPPKQEVYPIAETRFTPEMMNDPVKRGAYLATIGHCMDCHAAFKADTREHDYVNGLGKGGRKFGSSGATAANLTSSTKSGLGAWSNDEIKRALTDGVSRDGRKLGGQMRPEYYRKMTDADLDAIVAWLRTLPPID